MCRGTGAIKVMDHGQKAKLRVFTVVFLLFLVPVESSNPVGLFSNLLSVLFYLFSTKPRIRMKSYFKDTRKKTLLSFLPMIHSFSSKMTILRPLPISEIVLIQPALLYASSTNNLCQPFLKQNQFNQGTIFTFVSYFL